MWLKFDANIAAGIEDDGGEKVGLQHGKNFFCLITSDAFMVQLNGGVLMHSRPYQFCV